MQINTKKFPDGACASKPAEKKHDVLTYSALFYKNAHWQSVVEFLRGAGAAEIFPAQHTQRFLAA